MKDKSDVKIQIKKLKEEFNEKKKMLIDRKKNEPIIAKIFKVIENKIDEKMSENKFSIEAIDEILMESGQELKKILKKNNNNKSPKEGKIKESEEEKKKEGEEENEEQENENGLKNG